MSNLDWDLCTHEWVGVDDEMCGNGSTPVKCAVCGVPGEESEDGEVFWPAS